MSKVDLIQEWLKAGGQIPIEWHATTGLFYADFDVDKPPFLLDACGTGDTPLEALESLIEDVNDTRESQSLSLKRRTRP